MNLIEVLTNQRKGKCLIEAQTKLQELVKICSATGKKGKFFLTLTIGAAEDSTVVVTDDVTTKMPKPTTGSTTFYADENGALHREDPRQPELPAITRMDGDAVNE